MIRYILVVVAVVCLSTPAFAIDYREMPEEWQKARNAFLISRVLGCLYQHKNDTVEVREACKQKALDDSAICENKAGNNAAAFQDCLDKLPTPE